MYISCFFLAKQIHTRDFDVCVYIKWGCVGLSKKKSQTLRLIILGLTLSTIIEPRHEQICLRSFLLGLTQSELQTTEDGQKLQIWIFRKQRNCTVQVAKNNCADQLRGYCAAISCAGTTDPRLCFRICKSHVFL